MKSIAEWGQEIAAWAVTKGWHTENRSMDEWVALLHTEVSEAYEEYRNNHEPNEIYFSSPEGVSADEATVFPPKPEGIPIELADLAIRLFHMCERLNIDLEAAIEQKMAYNHTRLFRHGGKRT